MWVSGQGYHDGHRHVKDHRIGRESGRRLDGRLPVADGPDHLELRFEEPSFDREELLLVVGQQDTGPAQGSLPSVPGGENGLDHPPGWPGCGAPRCGSRVKAIMTGIDTSRTTALGASRVAASTAACPSRTVPTTWNSGSRSRRSIARNSSWSSANRTLARLKGLSRLFREGRMGLITLPGGPGVGRHDVGLGSRLS